MNNITVAVWGNKGAGKTAFSAALANSFSKYFSSILLVSGDKYSPAFSAWGIRTNSDDKRTKSIASLCALPDITEDILKKHITLCHDNNNIGLCGYLTTDDCELYESISGNAAQSFLTATENVSQITVVDCTIPQHDRITEKALKNADVVIILLEPNANGIGFVYSQNSFIANNLTDDRKYIYLAAKVTPNTAVNEFETRLGITLSEHRLPFTFDTISKLTSLELFKDYSGEYKETVDSVAKDIKDGVKDD
jgi:cellulose biosynthesis protein BcsQ